MRILVLGGTVFAGRAFTDAALASGHEVVHFHRGRSRPPDARVRTVLGDRTGDLREIAPGAWDAVVDTSGYLPQVVRRSAEALRTAGRYLFVSSISVYGDFSRTGLDEGAPVSKPLDPVPEAMTPETYGPLKAMCEEVVRQAFGSRALVVRPGLIVGPHDPTDRFTWWPVRVAAGGRVPAPGRPGRTVQFIDVRDLAAWMVRLLEGEREGTFNATGPAAPLAMAQVLEACARAGGGDAAFEWIDDEFLLAHGVKPWIGLPLWIPESDASLRGMMTTAIARAVDAGLAFRPVDETARDTLEWARTRPPDPAWKAGLAPDEERTLLEAWDRRG
jgi:2'-hydroxyisoflavone reductase